MRPMLPVKILSVFLMAIFIGAMPILVWSAEDAGAPAEIEAEKSKQGDTVQSMNDESQVSIGNAASDPAELEQTVYPGVKNCHLERGGNGEPTISIYYPEFGESPLDNELKKYAEGLANDFQEDWINPGKSDGEIPDSFGNWEETVFFTIQKPNPDVVSITFNIYTYTGGVHGMILIDVRNYELKTGKLLGFDDLFKKPEEAVQIMSKLCDERLRKTLGDEVSEDMLATGVAPEQDNFEALSLVADGVVVEFQPYQVGPWSNGQQHVEISLKELEPAEPNPLVWPKAALISD